MGFDHLKGTLRFEIDLNLSLVSVACVDVEHVLLVEVGVESEAAGWMHVIGPGIAAQAITEREDRVVEPQIFAGDIQTPVQPTSQRHVRHCIGGRWWGIHAVQTVEAAGI